MAVMINKTQNGMGILSVSVVTLRYVGSKMLKRHVYIILSALLLLGGCKDRDDDYNELLKDPAFAAALTRWQYTIDDQLSSLQSLISVFESNDYITDIAPAFKNGVEVGYRFTFLNRSPMTVTYKDPNKNFVGYSPLMSISQNNLVFYWMLDREWLLDDSKNKIPVTGSKGVIPKTVIGSDGYWYISSDAKATGAPPGADWINTAVKAADTKGSGRFIIADIDPSDPYFVKFTLSDDAWFNIPKHIPINIMYDNPGVFESGESRKLVFNIDGILPNENVDIEVADLSYNWKFSYDNPNKKNEITFTAPSAFTENNSFGEVSIAVKVGSRLNQLYRFNLVSNIYIGPAANEYGEIYYCKGDTVGIVYKKNNGEPGSGRVMSLDEGVGLYWYINMFNSMAEAYDDFDGFGNTCKALQNNSFIEGSFFSWLNEKNKILLGDNYDIMNSPSAWYIPAKEELNMLFLIMFGITDGQFERDAHTISINPEFFTVSVISSRAFNKMITYLGSSEITGEYWSSTEDVVYETNNVWFANVSYIGINTFKGGKSARKKVRAVLAY